MIGLAAARGRDAGLNAPAAACGVNCMLTKRVMKHLSRVNETALAGRPDQLPIEAVCVRDSDTVDRLGLPGIRMTLQYGVWIGRELCHPTDPLTRCKTRTLIWRGLRSKSATEFTCISRWANSSPATFRPMSA